MVKKKLPPVFLSRKQRSKTDAVFLYYSLFNNFTQETFLLFHYEEIRGDHLNFKGEGLGDFEKKYPARIFFYRTNIRTHEHSGKNHSLTSIERKKPCYTEKKISCIFTAQVKKS